MTRRTRRKIDAALKAKIALRPTVYSSKSKPAANVGRAPFSLRPTTLARRSAQQL
jgi:hypothetical protein